MKGKSAEPYEMEKSREGSGSKNIQIKKKEGRSRWKDTEQEQQGTRESLA